MQIPDSTICSLLNQGEEKGMEYLFTRYYKPLVLWAASFLNNIPQSEDLVQDFFIRLWEKRTQTSLQATTFKSFLYTSVRNLAFDRMEKKDPPAPCYRSEVFRQSLGRIRYPGRRSIDPGQKRNR